MTGTGEAVGSVVAVGVGEASGGEGDNTVMGAEGDNTVMGVGETTASDA